MPRSILDRKVDELLKNLPAGALADVVGQLKNRPTFQEQWPDEWQTGARRGKKRILQLEQIRKDKFTLADILSQDSEILNWWNNVESD